jgi:hypothetical protein
MTVLGRIGNKEGERVKKLILGCLKTALLIGFLWAIQGNPGYAGSPMASPQGNDPVKEAITKEITAYLDQFKGACFADAPFSIGDPKVFEAKISEKMNEIIVGQKGAAEIALKAPKSLGYHNSAEKGIIWKDYWVQLVFAFDPQAIPQGGAGYANRQTMMHEMTHHIEWLIGRKQLSKIEDPKTKKKVDNPMSERNTNYQDQVVNLLWELIVLGDPQKSNPSRKKQTRPSIMGEYISVWQAVETELGKLQKGSSAGNHPPDKDLKDLTGFNVELGNIQKSYLDGKCGGHLQDMAKLSLKLPKINPALEIEDKPGKEPGDPVTVKATLVNTDMNELLVPEELKPKFMWTKPDGKDINGNPITLTPVPEREAEIPVKLAVTFNEKEYIIAQAVYSLQAGPASGGGKAVLHMDMSVLDDLKPNQTFTLTAAVENIPASVSKLKFSWLASGNAPLPSDPPVQKYNAWCFQIVTPVNGKAACSITLKENYFQPPGQAYSSPPQKLQLLVQDEPYNKIVFLSADKDYRVKQ